MRRLMIIATIATSAAALAVPTTASAAGPSVVLWDMNEAPGATVIHDTSGNGVNGTINPAGVQSGYSVLGATGYHWVRRNPTAAPPSPERVVQIPDNPMLDPLNDTFTIEIRYRTKEKFGNIIQKGQAHTVGGQWKIQNPKGIPSCLFRSSPTNQIATGAKTPLNDNQWHVLTCVKTPTSVTMYVDGVFRNKKNGVTGTIDNKKPVTIGGKIECDQVSVTCDYFSGEIDYVKLTHSG